MIIPNQNIEENGSCLLPKGRAILHSFETHTLSLRKKPNKDQWLTRARRKSYEELRIQSFCLTARTVVSVHAFNEFQLTDLHEPTCMFYYTQVRVMTRSLHVSLVQCAVHASGTAFERLITIFLTAKVHRTWNNLLSMAHSVSVI